MFSRLLRLLSFSVIFISMSVLGQSSRISLDSQANNMPVAQHPHPGLAPNLFRGLRWTPFAQHPTEGTWADALPSATTQPSGLDFAPAVFYGSGGINPGSAVVVDVNGDGKPDLIVANLCGSDSQCYQAGSVGVLLGKGDGTFEPAVTYDSGGVVAESVEVADVNGDGKPDIIVANQYDSTASNGLVGVLLGNGDGTFQAAVTYSSGGLIAESVAVADVNGDGVPDLIVANDSDLGHVSGSVSILLGNGDGTFQRARSSNSGGYDPTSVLVVDINRDGYSDLLVVNDGSNTVGLLMGNGNGTFKEAVVYDSGGYFPYSAVLSDVNGDGMLDVVVANNCSDSKCTQNGSIGVLLGHGDGTFETAVPYGSGGQDAISVAVSDINGDGKPDLIVTNNLPGSPSTGASWAVGVLLGNGDGTFQSAVMYGAGVFYASALVAADVNGDSKPDILIATPCDGAGKCSNSNYGSEVVLLNTSALDTTPPVITLIASPTTLWPPNGKMVVVTISGTITDSGSGVRASTASFTVVDEYGQVQPNGHVALGSLGNYSTTLFLEASRDGSDKDGRQYTVTVSAKDNAGNVGFASRTVSVPLDRGK